MYIQLAGDIVLFNVCLHTYLLMCSKIVYSHVQQLLIILSLKWKQCVSRVSFPFTTMITCVQIGNSLWSFWLSYLCRNRYWIERELRGWDNKYAVFVKAYETIVFDVIMKFLLLWWPWFTLKAVNAMTMCVVGPIHIYMTYVLLPYWCLHTYTNIHTHRHTHIER